MYLAKRQLDTHKQTLSFEGRLVGLVPRKVKNPNKEGNLSQISAIQMSVGGHGRESTGTRPDYLVNRATKKIEGHSSKGRAS